VYPEEQEDALGDSGLNKQYNELEFAYNDRMEHWLGRDGVELYVQMGREGELRSYWATSGRYSTKSSLDAPHKEMDGDSSGM
jgi:hypothetical protein